MDDLTILDADELEQKNNIYFDVIYWWEKKRLLFNGLLIATEILMMFTYDKGTIAFGLTQAILYSLAYTIVGNILFSLGAIIEICSLYFKISIQPWLVLRSFLLFIGILFSVMLTIYCYQGALYYNDFYFDF